METWKNQSESWKNPGKVLKFVSEKGNEAWKQVSFTKVTAFKALHACKVVQVDFFCVSKSSSFRFFDNQVVARCTFVSQKKAKGYSVIVTNSRKSLQIS